MPNMKHCLRNLYVSRGNRSGGPPRATVRDVDFYRSHPNVEPTLGVEHVVLPSIANPAKPLPTPVVVDFCPIEKWNAMSTTARHHWFIAGRR